LSDTSEDETKPGARPMLIGACAGLVFCACVFCACGGGMAEPSAAPPPSPEAAASSPKAPKPVPRTEALANAQVFDERGKAAPCGQASPNCPPAPVSNDFLDKCRLAGFRAVQCGCDQRCTGDVSSSLRRYDAAGQPKDCAPARTDCTPPQAAAAFQDACTERGFRLEVCGCEWLCSGDFKH
jgi:hypothetical protein